MQTLERDILETDRRIGQQPPEHVRLLEKKLRDLTPEQNGFAQAVMKRARQREHLPLRHLHLLEHFFEKWSAHSLATKLVLITRITKLASELAGDHDGNDPARHEQLFHVPPWSPTRPDRAESAQALAHCSRSNWAQAGTILFRSPAQPHSRLTNP